MKEYQYNHREYAHTDLRRYVNMGPDSIFHTMSENEVFNQLGKEALTVVLLQMIKETVCYIAMFAQPKETK